MSFYSFISENYELSNHFLPKKKPNDDSLNEDEMNKLIGFIREKDFYEINSFIREKYLIKKQDL